MEQLQRNMVAGILALGVFSGGCMKSDPQGAQGLPEKNASTSGVDKAPDSAVTQSFHDYSIPLNLAEVQAEVVYREGVSKTGVSIPADFSPRAFLEKIVSGGQTGVDRAALDFGLEHKIEVGGWCPKGRYAEDGAIPARYPLIETEQTEVTWRTEFNARDSDGSLVIVENHLMRGTGYTREMAIKHGRPYWIQPVDAPLDHEEFARWLIANDIRVLNIGGPRESDQPGSVYNHAHDLLEKLVH